MSFPSRAGRLSSALILVSASLMGQVSTASVVVGGPGATGCQSGGPVLTGGVPASATVDFVYDESTNVLQVVVANTSPVFTGIPNPLATQIYFNLPHMGISSLSLLSQSGSGGATPNFMLLSDVDTRDGLNQIGVNCYGDFGACLSVQGAQGGIANPAADTLSGPAGSQVIGPVTFDLLVTPTTDAVLNAQAFANGYSVNGSPANLAIKFQGGGPGGQESGVISDVVRCDPSLWFVGDPSIGNTVTFAFSGFPGCPGCLLASMDPGPTDVNGTLYSIGTPAIVVVESTPAADAVLTYNFTIPNDAQWVGQTWYLIVVLFANGQIGEQTHQLQVTVQP